MDYHEISDLILEENIQENAFRNEVIRDFWICCVSREASLAGRKEVLTGKAKFGITGDGKEVAQVALARAMKNGDWRSGYYRDQTLMLSLGLCTVKQYFAQLYADAENDPFSGGRQMNNHFATRLVDDHGEWIDQLAGINVSADVSCTGGQMARALGHALASKLYRINAEVFSDIYSQNGDEVCICTIGDASTSEGIFWETINAAAVQKVPLSVSIWDDGYGISVPIELQTTKGSISKLLEGFLLDENGHGIRMYTCEGWDYPQLVALYERGIEQTRESHIPSVFHIREMTQPQGHSTSGSHERYKSQERLQWERENDCILKMEKWMIENHLCTEEEALSIRTKAREYVKRCRNEAKNDFYQPVKDEIQTLKSIYAEILNETISKEVEVLSAELDTLFDPMISDLYKNAKNVAYELIGYELNSAVRLKDWLKRFDDVADKRYHTHLFVDHKKSALKIPVVHPSYSEEPESINGYQILNRFFDKALEKHANLVAFGEDVGKIGGVNQGFAGLQEKYGDHRVFDTGIREWTIIGQAVGMSMRGLRPIAEIQYLDYLIYAMSVLSDDLASLHYRSAGIQSAPCIIRTRGHRLEGIWHAGSPMGLLLNGLQGIYLCVPRNMTQAAGIYNTLLQSDDPGIVIECLNGYRLKEPCPENLGEFSLPLGVPEVIVKGTDITLVTYGSCVKEAVNAEKKLKKVGISVEIIDVQTLLPFDLERSIIESLKKTSRVIFVDEDIPGGGSAYMMQKVLEEHGGYYYLDTPPHTLTSHAHRPPYGSDGDYFSKPNPESIFEIVYEMMQESFPDTFPAI